jgi:uncharacterized membrane protein
MRTFVCAFALLTAGLLGACGSDSSGGGSGGSSSSGTGGSSSSQTCNVASGCLNGSCKCSAGPNKDQACCGADSSPGCSGMACDSLCKVCQ